MEKEGPPLSKRKLNSLQECKFPADYQEQITKKQKVIEQQLSHLQLNHAHQKELQEFDYDSDSIIEENNPPPLVVNTDSLSSTSSSTTVIEIEETLYEQFVRENFQKVQSIIQTNALQDYLKNSFMFQQTPSTVKLQGLQFSKKQALPTHSGGKETKDLCVYKGNPLDALIKNFSIREKKKQQEQQQQMNNNNKQSQNSSSQTNGQKKVDRQSEQIKIMKEKEQVYRQKQKEYEARSKTDPSLIECEEISARKQDHQSMMSEIQNDQENCSENINNHKNNEGYFVKIENFRWNNIQSCTSCLNDQNNGEQSDEGRGVQHSNAQVNQQTGSVILL